MLTCWSGAYGVLPSFVDFFLLRVTLVCVFTFGLTVVTKLDLLVNNGISLVLGKMRNCVMQNTNGKMRNEKNAEQWWLVHTSAHVTATITELISWQHQMLTLDSSLLCYVLCGLLLQLVEVFFDCSRQYCLMMNDTLSSHDILLSDCLQTKTDFSCVLYAKLLWVLLLIVNSQSHMQSFLIPLVSELNWTMVIFQV